MKKGNKCSGYNDLQSIIRFRTNGERTGQQTGILSKISESIISSKFKLLRLSYFYLPAD